MKGFATDEQAILNILLTMSNQQRVATVKYFEHEFNRNLVEELCNELGEHYEDLAVALLYAPVEYTIRQLNTRIENMIDYDSDDLIELICTKNVEELNLVDKRYHACKY